MGQGMAESKNEKFKIKKGEARSRRRALRALQIPDSRFKNCANDQPGETMDYDLLIKNGRVVDGSGLPSYVADVGIKDGKITEIGRLGGSAAYHA